MKQRNEGKKFNNFIVQGGILALSGVLVRLLGLAKRIPLTYIIGDLGNSYYSAAYDIYNIVFTIAVYGIPLSVSKLVSARVSKGQYKNANKIFKCTMVFSLVMGFISSLLVFIFADSLSAMLNEPMSFMALRVLSPTLLVVAVMATFRGYFQGMGSMVPTAISQLLEQVVLIIVSLTAAFFLSKYGYKVGLLLHNSKYENAYGAAGATLGCSIGALFSLIFLFILYKKYKVKLEKQMYRDNTIQIESTLSVYKTLIFTIVPVVVSSFVNNISNFLDHFIHNAILPKIGMEEQMSVNWGIYSGKYIMLVNVPIAISAAMGASSVPTISGLMRCEEYGEVREKISKVIKVTMMIAIPCAVGLFVLAPELIWCLFSTTEPLAPSLVRIGAIMVVFFSLSTLTNGILQGMSHMIKPITHALLALAVHVPLLCLLLFFTDLNTKAVALSNDVFSLLICIMNIIAIRKAVGYVQEFRYTFIMPFVSAGIMGAVLFGLNKVFMHNGYSRVFIILEIFIGALVYFIAMLLTKSVTREEILSLPGGSRLARVLTKLHII